MMCSHYRAVRQERELYPYPSEIRLTDTRNSRTFEKDEITISVASEICRYGTDIQKEVYYKHLKDSDSMLYDCWRGLKAAEVAKFIERDFTTDLSRYAFDKTLCASCPHNTNNMMLFCEGGCGNCANRSCLVK